MVTKPSSSMKEELWFLYILKQNIYWIKSSIWLYPQCRSSGGRMTARGSIQWMQGSFCLTYLALGSLDYLNTGGLSGPLAWGSDMGYKVRDLIFKHCSLKQVERSWSTDFMFSVEDSENMQECHMSQNLRHEVKPVEMHYGTTVEHELQCSHITFINHRVTVFLYISI